MAELQRNPQASFTVRADQPLIGVIEQQDGQEMVRYFTDEQELDQRSRQQSIQKALALAGAWSDLDWDEMEQALDQERRTAEQLGRDIAEWQHAIDELRLTVEQRTEKAAFALSNGNDLGRAANSERQRTQQGDRPAYRARVEE